MASFLFKNHNRALALKCDNLGLWEHCVPSSDGCAKAPSYVTNHLLPFFFQIVLQKQKLEELERVAGKGLREEEPEGEDLVEEEGSGNHLQNKLTFLPQLVQIPISMPPLFNYQVSSPGLVFLTDDSDEEVAPRPEIKEERDLGIIHSWVQVEGFPALPEEEAWGLLQEVGSLFLPDTYMTVFPYCSLFIPHFTSPFLCFLFQGLGMLKTASSLKEEAHGLEEEAQQLKLKDRGK